MIMRQKRSDAILAWDFPWDLTWDLTWDLMWDTSVGVNKARRVLEGKILKTFGFMDGKIDYVHERIDKIEKKESNNVEQEIAIE